MNIAIVGYGKMGKSIEGLCLQRGHNISFKIGIDNINEINKISAHNTDVAIEFSTPDSGFKNCRTLISNGVRTISGTTGWVENIPTIEKLSREKSVGFLYASNFSIGVNLFFQLNKFLASIMAQHEAYEISMEEWHHIHKLDAPSGTSITLAQNIVNQIDRIKNYKLIEDISVKYSNSDLPIIAHREGEIPGTHAIKYESELDSIEIIHTAKSRKSFALGAVLVAEWMKGKNKLFTMEDFLASTND